MLRKGLVALMIGVICAGSAMAADSSPKRPNPAPTGLLGWLKNKSSEMSKKPAGSATAKSSSKARGTSNTHAVARNAAAASDAKAKLPMLARRPATNVDGGVQRAVVNDAERQAVQVRQTAGRPQDSAPTMVPEPPELLDIPFELPTVEAESALQPVPIQQAPVLPNTQTVSGPQYFSATPAGMSNPVPVHPSNNWQNYQAPQPVQVTSQGQYWNASHSPAPAGPAYNGYAQMSPQNGYYPQNGAGYPQTGAALYPAPVPGIPHQVGGISIENPAFHPHEMLYAHRYSAMYPPYYYKVNGGWMLTPFGVWSRENWKLEGTRVDVKYKSHISPLTFFHPPAIH